jgi:uncharacterized protein YlxW (UPF0749 family)
MSHEAPPPREQGPEPVDPATAPAKDATPRQWREALRLRRTRTQLVIGVLCTLLGFGVVAQVRATTDDNLLSTARTPDLIRLLDDLGQRQQRLDSERTQLLETRDRLVSGVDTGAAALREATERSRTLGILAGTVPASGPGVVVRITDPEQRVNAAVLLDTVQELRDAGAQAIQIDDVRVVASTSFVDGPGEQQVSADGTVLTRPFVVRAVGDPDTMAAALAIPGGVVDTVSQAGGTATVAKANDVAVDALRVLPTPRYARTVPTP